MKIKILFLCLVGLTIANNVGENENDVEGRFFPGNIYKTVKYLFWAKKHMGNIKSYINEYFDKVTSNIEGTGNKTGLSNVSLSNVTESFLTAHINLWNGSLHGLNYINRTDDVVVEYSHKDKKIVVILPIVLDKIQFFYDYHVVLLLLGPKGKMIGTVDRFKAYMNLTFDFNEYHFKIHKLSTWGMGKITLHFEDAGLVDLVANILSEFATDFLHPLIEGVINNIINSVANNVVDTINGAIDNALKRNTTDTEVETNVEKLFQTILSKDFQNFLTE